MKSNPEKSKSNAHVEQLIQSTLGLEISKRSNNVSNDEVSEVLDFSDSVSEGGDDSSLKHEEVFIKWRCDIKEPSSTCQTYIQFITSLKLTGKPKIFTMQDINDLRINCKLTKYQENHQELPIQIDSEDYFLSFDVKGKHKQDFTNSFLHAQDLSYINDYEFNGENYNDYGFKGETKGGYSTDQMSSQDKYNSSEFSDYYNVGKMNSDDYESLQRKDPLLNRSNVVEISPEEQERRDLELALALSMSDNYVQEHEYQQKDAGRVSPYEHMFSDAEKPSTLTFTFKSTSKSHGLFKQKEESAMPEHISSDKVSPYEDIFSDDEKSSTGSFTFESTSKSHGLFKQKEESAMPEYLWSAYTSAARKECLELCDVSNFLAYLTQLLNNDLSGNVKFNLKDLSNIKYLCRVSKNGLKGECNYTVLDLGPQQCYLYYLDENSSDIQKSIESSIARYAQSNRMENHF